MGLSLVFNDLSAIPADSKREAQSRFEEFILCLRAHYILGVPRELRVPSDFHALTLAPEYSMAQWRNDASVPRELRDYLRSIVTRSPFLDGFPDLVRDIGRHEFRHRGAEALGLGVAVLLDAIGVSFLSAEEWDNYVIHVEHSYLTDVDAVETMTEAVPHAARREHSASHAELIEKELRGGVESGSDLWDRRTELLPALQFCPCTEVQLRALMQGSPLLVQVVRHLREMQRYCENWRLGGFDSSTYPTHVSPESEATLNQFGEERTFICPDGLNRTFSWHVRITPGAWRLYFVPDPSSRSMIIGYIGRHLRIAGES